MENLDKIPGVRILWKSDTNVKQWAKYKEKNDENEYIDEFVR